MTATLIDATTDKRAVRRMRFEHLEVDGITLRIGQQSGSGNIFDENGNVGDPSKMSETAKQQALQKLMGDLQKLYEMLSNMIKSMHDMQMTPVRNLRG